MDIKNAIFRALHISYNEAQIFKLNYDGQTFSLPEYFLTVNLCKQLKEWNEKTNKYYRIEAEKRTSELYSGCFQDFRLEVEGDIFSQMLFVSNDANYSEFHKEIRKGKVDIALTLEGSGFNTISDCVIEIKAINPSTTKLSADFYRICCFLKPEIDGFPNLMKKGYLTFIKHENSRNKIQTDHEFEKMRNNYIRRLQKQFEKLCPENLGFKFVFEVIDKFSYEDFSGNFDEDFHENAYRTFMAYSVIVEVFKKK